jgi:Holliday junction resolvase
MPQAGMYGKAGVPDYLCCHNGKFIAIETKARGNKPTKLQEKQLNDITNAGGISLVLNEDNYEKLRTVLGYL